MHYEIDLTKTRKQFAELKNEVTSPDEVFEAARTLYRREGDAGPFKLDAAFRDGLIAELDRHIGKEKTEGELAALRREKDAALVWDEVQKSLLGLHYRRELLDGATALFLAKHKIAVYEQPDGTRKVMASASGPRGWAEAKEAAITWADEQEISGLVEHESAAGFFTEQLKRIH